MERILVAVDGSASSLKAVGFTADLASKYNAELILVTIVPYISKSHDSAIEEYARLEHIPLASTELALAMAESALDSARREAQAKGATRIAAQPSFCDPAKEIISIAEDQRVDLVIVGSRGHGRLAGLELTRFGGHLST